MNQIQYQVLCNRRQNSDAMVWQVPSIAIAGQAFLLSTSLSSSTNSNHALILALSSAWIGTASVQLMAKHRQREVEDAERLRLFEEKEENQALNFEIIHGQLDPPGSLTRSWLVNRSSYGIWQRVLMGFVLLAAYSAISASLKLVSCLLGADGGLYSLVPLLFRGGVRGGGDAPWHRSRSDISARPPPPPTPSSEEEGAKLGINCQAPFRKL